MRKLPFTERTTTYLRIRSISALHMSAVACRTGFASIVGGSVTRGQLHIDGGAVVRQTSQLHGLAAAPAIFTSPANWPNGTHEPTSSVLEECATEDAPGVNRLTFRDVSCINGMFTSVCRVVQREVRNVQMYPY